MIAINLKVFSKTGQVPVSHSRASEYAVVIQSLEGGLAYGYKERLTIYQANRLFKP